MSKKKTKNEIKNKQKSKPEAKTKTTHPLVKVILKMTVLTVLVGTLIFYLDYKGYFNPNKDNDHTLKKWNSFYDLTQENMEIDIMLFGNSHLYTGINPKNLSLATGTNAFVFAAPGTSISDSYFGLREAIKTSKPKLVIIETYGINDFNNYDFKDGALSDQFVSFAARRDFITKMKSTPYLFTPDNYLYAWSTTIRNHDYIFNNQKQLKKNKAQISKRKRREIHKDKDLYLGRFVRFTTGIKDSVLHLYDSLGAPVNGEHFSLSSQAEFYVAKLVELCENENINLMFLTLPMYQKHVENYEVWQERLAKLLNKYSSHWLDLQATSGYKGFDKESFENTYNTNQHITYKGSLMATYKLANYIEDSLSVKFPDRKNDEKWHELFYGEEGYFENFNPKSDDNSNKILFSDRNLNNIKVNECLLLDLDNKKRHKIMIKVDRDRLKDKKLNEYKIGLMLRFEIDGKEQVAQVDLFYDRFHPIKQEAIFSNFLKPIKIKQVMDGKLLKKK